MRFSDDDRLNPSHVSLYLALFQFWNMNRFQNPISINRSEVMLVSKIGSNATYHRCIKQLDEWSYLEYIPSYNPMKGSKINMFIFETSSEQALNGNHPKNEQVVGQVLVPSINSINNTKNNKQNKGESNSPNSKKRKTQKRFSPPSLDEVIKFFKEKKASTEDPEKFFNHFESNGWKVGGKTKMKNWQAAARNWILRSNEFKKGQNQTSSRLNVNESKNYDIPL
ncbi:MAG: transcriptional regulator [Fluviicola sp.]|nr:MAG: transcriptional regulator [Fluviicola sp.]